MIRQLAIVSSLLLISAFVLVEEASAQGNDSFNFTRGFLSKRATTSPYLALAFNRQTGMNFGNAGLYQNQVRPKLEARRAERAQSLQFSSVQKQINQLNRPLPRSTTARRPSGNRGQQQLIPTGHPTGFMTYLHYYPSAGR